MKVYLKILSFLTPLIALAISFGLTTFILILIDRDPVETFTLMFDYGTTCLLYTSPSPRDRG